MLEEIILSCQVVIVPCILITDCGGNYVDEAAEGRLAAGRSYYSRDTFGVTLDRLASRSSEC